MTVSYWLDSPYDLHPALVGHRTADVAVVGGGMTGVGLAYFLSERGIKAVVLEMGALAGGATGRNAGFLVSGLGEHYARSVEFWGRADAAAISRLHLRNHAMLAEIVARQDVDCDYRREGGFVIAGDDEEEELLRKSHPLLIEDGFLCEFVDSAQVNRILHTTGFGGGLFNPSDGSVNPVRLVRAIAASAHRRNTQFFECTTLRRLRQTGSSWLLEAEHGTVSAGLVFLACNAWLPVFLPQVRLQPVRGQCLAVGPLAAPPAAVPCYANYGSEYWRGAGSHFILGGMRRAGGRDELGYADGTSTPVQNALEDYCFKHFPQFAGAAVSHRWSGVMSYSADGLPLVGAVSGKEGLYLAAGYTGHGFGWAFLAARWLVDLALDNRDSIPALCRIDRQMHPSPSLESI